MIKMKGVILKDLEELEVSTVKQLSCVFKMTMLSPDSVEKLEEKGLITGRPGRGGIPTVHLPF